MPFSKLISMGTAVLIILLVFSCQDKTAPIQENPAPLISKKEVHEIIDATELLRILIKESFVQLLFNHDFNPLMPQIPTRMSCVDCTHADCGCPFQDTSLDPDINVFPQLLAMKYYDPNEVDCTCTLATSPSGLKVTGEMKIHFSESFTTNGHVITIYPQDDFEVDGYDIDADSIQIEHRPSGPGGPGGGGPSGPITIYKITAIDGVKITKNGDVTVFNSIDPNKSEFIIDDIGDNHGNIANAYGLLDDIFELKLHDLSITCSNSVEVLANTGENLVYDMSCNNIQDGIVSLLELNRDTIVSYDYGAPAMGTNIGICDDSILVIPPHSGT